MNRNPLRAGLVRRAKDWRWGGPGRTGGAGPPLSPWPVPRRWVEVVHAAQTQAEEEAVQTAGQRGRPLGDQAWMAQTAERLGRSGTLRTRGRPPKNREVCHPFLF